MNSEKGVSLIITFFIMVIVLAVVLAVSSILYSEIKIIRNIGDSVVAFYAADSGVEKTLYYDRKFEGGACNLCQNCPEDDCKNCVPPAGEDGENCEVNFDTDLIVPFGNKKYHVKAVVSQKVSDNNPVIKYSELDIFSTGSYNSVLGATPMKRAIELISKKDETENTVPDFTATATPFSVEDGAGIDIITENVNAHGFGISSIKAHIKRYDDARDETPDEEDIDFCEGCAYEGHVDGQAYTFQHTGPVGVYYVEVEVCDNKQEPSCSDPFEINNITP